jgi:hypothetical protein
VICQHLFGNLGTTHPIPELNPGIVFKFAFQLTANEPANQSYRPQQYIIDHHMVSFFKIKITK